MSDQVCPGTKRLLSQSPLPPQESYELINVQAFVRHAARTPVDTLVSEKWENQAMWLESMHNDLVWNKTPYKLINLNTQQEMNESDVGDFLEIHKLNGGAISGRVTTKGQADLYEVGQTFRRRYSQCLFGRESMKQNDFYLQASGFARSIVSGKCLAAGLKNLKEEDVDQETLPIFSLKVTEEVLLPNFRQNKEAILAKQKSQKFEDVVPEILEVKKKLRDIFEVDRLQMRKDVVLKADIINTKDCPIVVMIDEYLSRMYHNLPVPEDFIHLLPEIIRLGSEESFFHGLGLLYKSYNVTDINLFCKPLITLIVNRLEYLQDDSSKSNQQDVHPESNEIDSKMQLYIGHDFTLVVILLALGAFDYVWPSFGEHLIFETYRHSGGGLFVQLIFSGRALLLENLGASNEDPLIPIENLINHLSGFSCE